MININNETRLQPQSAITAEAEENENWFDAIDYVEVQEEWFDARNTLPAEAAAEKVVPFTEDCQRCIKQLIAILGSYKQSELIACGLAKILPGIPAHILLAADSLYSAIAEKRNIDIAVLHTLGLSSEWLPDNINMISWVASYLRRTVLDYAGDTFCRQFLAGDENPAPGYVFTLLAITAIAARHWIGDVIQPQRRLLQMPAFLANLLVRAGHYWKALGNMIQPTIPASENPIPTKPAFEIDTSIEVTQPLPESTASPAITDFLSNSTTLAEFFTKATVQNRKTVVPSASKNIAEQTHALATAIAKQETGLSELLYCETHKTETMQHQHEHIITHTHFNTRCDAIMLPTQPPSTDISFAENIMAPAAIPASSITNRNDGNAAFPLITAAALVATVKSFTHIPLSKKIITASAVAGTTALIWGGKTLLNKFSPEEIINTQPPPILFKRKKRVVDKESENKIKKQTVEKLILQGNHKKLFRKFKLQSDITGKLNKTTIDKLISSNIFSFGSEMYNSEGFLTLTLPRQKDAIKASTAGITNALKKGMNTLEFTIRINTQTSKTLFFRINGVHNTELFSMSKKGNKLFVNHDNQEKIIRNSFTSLTNATHFEVMINKGSASFITVLMNTNKVFSDFVEKKAHQYFIGISCSSPGHYFRSVDIKDISKTYMPAHKLHVDWHNYVSVVDKAGIIFDRAINPFSNESIVFYGSEENLNVKTSRKKLVEEILPKLRHRRAITDEATFTTVLNAVSMAYLTHVLGDPKTSRADKELAIIEYLKIAAADTFSFSAGLIDHMDPYSLVSAKYALGMKGLLKTGGASLGVIFNTMNFINGVKENDIARIVSATASIAGVIASVVLSGFTSFGVTLFLLGLSLIADAISDAKKRGEIREKYFQQTILLAERNKLFHYTWMAKTNQDGNSEKRYNAFKLDEGNTPSLEQKNDEDDKPLFYTMLTGDVDVTPEMVGSVNGTTTFNTDPNSEKEGYKGFQTRVKENDDEISHLIYTSHVMVHDTSYFGHVNQGQDSILADGTLLKGDDTIVSASINAKIDAGEGNDIIFVSGREESIDGGTGSNIAIIDGKEGKVTLNIYGDGDASLSSGTKLLNIAGFIITGTGHKVIINTAGLINIVPLLVCQGDGIIILRNPVGNGQDAIVKEYGSKGRVKEEHDFKFYTVLNRVSIGEKTIAMQKGFGVKQVYDD